MMILHTSVGKEEQVDIPILLMCYFLIVNLTGFLCGHCPRRNSDDNAQGLAFNLLSCVTCDKIDIMLFLLICEYIM